MHKYRWNESYDMISVLCAGPTNCHIRSNSLRAEDGTSYSVFRERLYTIGKESLRKHRRIQERYRRRRRQSLAERFAVVNGSD